MSEPCGSPKGEGKVSRMERETGIEPATNSLEGCDSTTELLPPLYRRLGERRLGDGNSYRSIANHAIATVSRYPLPSSLTPLPYQG